MTRHWMHLYQMTGTIAKGTDSMYVPSQDCSSQDRAHSTSVSAPSSNAPRRKRLLLNALTTTLGFALLWPMFAVGSLVFSDSVDDVVDSEPYRSNF